MTDEEIIIKLWERVGHFQGFNHKDVKRMLRKAMKIAREDERAKAREEVKSLSNHSPQVALGLSKPIPSKDVGVGLSNVDTNNQEVKK